VPIPIVAAGARNQHVARHPGRMYDQDPPTTTMTPEPAVEPQER
jgi:hypothetical protein